MAMTRVVFFFLFSIVISTSTSAQKSKIPSDFCISQDEYELFQLINDYRLAYGLPKIPLSKSLSFVAKTHVKDLSVYYNPKSNCNMHSWSKNGTWVPICFPEEQSKKNNVWLKAKEIVGYSSEAYEVTYWSNVANQPNNIFGFWSEQKPSSDMLFNKGQWANSSWNAIGIGIKNGYAVAFFGKAIDAELNTVICSSNQKIINELSPEFIVAHSSTSNIETPVHYITIASFNTRKDADNAVKSYKEMGYPKTVLIEADNKIRVAIDYFTDKKEADQALKKYAIKFKGAWVLTI